MSKKHKHRDRIPGIPSSAAPNLPTPDGMPKPSGHIRYEDEDGTVEQMAYWERDVIASAAASLGG